jgi:hypothetical protein
VDERVVEPGRVSGRSQTGIISLISSDNGRTRADSRGEDVGDAENVLALSDVRAERDGSSLLGRTSLLGSLGMSASRPHYPYDS